MVTINILWWLRGRSCSPPQHRKRQRTQQNKRGNITLTLACSNPVAPHPHSPLLVTVQSPGYTQDEDEEKFHHINFNLKGSTNRENREHLNITHWKLNLLKSIDLAVWMNRWNREFSHVNFQKLTSTRAWNRHMTPMSLTWPGQVLQLSCDESEIGGWSDRRRWGVWRRNWDMDGTGLSHSCVGQQSYIDLSGLSEMSAWSLYRARWWIPRPIDFETHLTARCKSFL